MAKGKRSSSFQVRERSKERAKEVNRKWRVVFLAVVAALLIAVFVVVRNIIALHIEKSKLTGQEQALQNRKEELTAELDGVDDLDYIEEQARKLLKMIKPGEVLYILNGEDPRPESARDDKDEVVIIPQPVPAAPQEEVVPEEPVIYDQVYEEEYAEEYSEEVEEETYEEPVEETEESEEESEEYSEEETTEEYSEEYTEDSSTEFEG